jgi:hypothetical protein
MPKFKEVLVQLMEPLKISMMIFTPALLLVLGGFYFMSPTVLSQLIDLRREEINKKVEEEVNKKISTLAKGGNQPEVKITLVAGEDTKLDAKTVNSINENIKKQLKEEIEKNTKTEIKDAAKAELENSMKSLKGDLYKDISIPVIFAIASIFAAFAVKDVLTEILKKEEKEAVISDITSDVTKNLKTVIGITELDEPTGLPKDFKTKLEEYAETKVNGKIQDLKIKELHEIWGELDQLKETTRKVDEIEYEVSDLTASRMSENISYNKFLLSTYQRPLSIIKRLSENEPADERLRLSHEYQLEVIEQIIKNENKEVATSEDEQNFSSDDLNSAMDNFFEVRMAQFYILLDNLISEAGNDKEEIERFNKKIQEIEQLSIPLSGIIKKTRKNIINKKYNDDARDEDMKTFPGEATLPAISEASSSAAEASQS